MTTFVTFLCATGIPGIIITALVGFLVKRIERRMEEDRKERLEAEEARRRYEIFQLKGLTATMALCEANAKALQNGKCNGETHAALEYLKKTKHEQREFLMSQGIDHIF